MRFLLMSLLAFSSMGLVAQTVQIPLPEIRQNGAVKQIFVDGKPFIMLAGELHNSSASSIEYMKPIWSKLDSMNLNTVVSTVNWELLEPEEGQFNYDLIDAQIQEAAKRNIRLVMIWFASWKNGDSQYAPLWVKTNPHRFPIQLRNRRAKFFGPGGELPAPLSPLGEATMVAEAKAYRALMKHIRETDPNHTVIMMQVDNEMGLMGDSRDRSPLAEAVWTQPVPAELMNYLAKNKSTLLPEMQEVWGRNGYKKSGTWSEIFGTDEWAGEVFQAWCYSCFINKVISEGKAELNIPMYVNAWLGPQPGELVPGDWPSGGPVSRVTDIWRAGAPAADLFAPDIYVDDFKGVLAEYSRMGNPLWIPEARDLAGNLFWALGHHSALGWSIFGIDDLKSNCQVGKAYGLLIEMIPQLTGWQAAEKVDGFLLLNGEENQVITMGGYKLTISRPHRNGASPAPDNGATAATLMAGGISSENRAGSGDTRPFGIVISIAQDEFLFVGSNFNISFDVDSQKKSKVAIGSIDEGAYYKGIWVPGRRLNGDESSASISGKSIGMLKIKVYQH